MLDYNPINPQMMKVGLEGAACFAIESLLVNSPFPFQHIRRG
jgi:hypothetical protein